MGVAGLIGDERRLAESLPRPHLGEWLAIALDDGFAMDDEVDLVAEISFLGMTGEGGKLRHASFKRLLEAGPGEADIADLSA